MARRTGLRDYQQSLLERLKEVEHAPASSSKLGFLLGSERWLVDIAETEEILPVPEIAALPFTQPWFLGISNVRGNLVGIVDFLGFVSDESAPRAPHNRVIVFEGDLGARFGILVSRMLGLKRSDELQPRADQGRSSPLVRAVHEDPDGSLWSELDARALLADRRFLNAGAL